MILVEACKILVEADKKDASSIKRKNALLGKPV
jgi:hypothetical protein